MAQQLPKPSFASLWSRQLGMAVLPALLILFLGGSMFIQSHYRLPQLKKDRESHANQYKLGYLPDGKYAKIAVFDYDLIAAHLLWLRSIQYFGGLFRSVGKDKYEPILHLFDVITDLEPRFIDAYSFGSMVIGEEAKNPQKALELLDKGMWKNPRKKYKIAYDGLFQCVWSVKDPDFDGGLYYCNMALKCQDCPPWVEGIKNHLLFKQGRRRWSFEESFKQMLEYADSGNEVFELLRHNKCKTLLRDWTLIELNIAYKKFLEKEGQAPETLQELADKKYLAEFETYNWESLIGFVQYHRGQGAESLTPFRDTMLNASRIKGVVPKNPVEKDEGFTIYRNLPAEREEHVFTTKRLRESVQSSLDNPRIGLRAIIKRYHEQHKKFPAKLTDMPEIVDEKGRLKYIEPFTGQWDYDPNTGTVKCPRYPEY